MGIEFEPIWFDSLGAKSSCTLVRTPDAAILIDPGCAAMQPSYPLPEVEKLALLKQALQAICKAVEVADYVVITHYHYDHFLPEPRLYEGKTLWLKDPNCWINRSQWARAREFIAALAEHRDRRRCQSHSQSQGQGRAESGGEGEGGGEGKGRGKGRGGGGGKDKGEGEGGSLSPLREPLASDLDKLASALAEDPLERLPLAKAKDFGHYQRRREELLSRGRERLEGLKGLWRSGPWLDEAALGRLGVEFVDGRALQLGGTTVRFIGPLFHGIEYANTGWVIAVVVEHGGEKLLYSSDLEGPTIEDYAEWIISEWPNYLILDGPSTYLLGYMLNRTNLARAIANAKRIAKECEPHLRVMLFDHHLLRDRRYRERTAEVWQASPKVVTAAEWLGKRPLIDQLD